MKDLKFEPLAIGAALDLLAEAFQSFNESVANLVQNSEHFNEKTEDIAVFLVRVSVVHGRINRLKLDTDESYSLVLKARGADIVANITANTYFGARHGLETLSQLVW